jgi:hypothetical protein
MENLKNVGKPHKRLKIWGKSINFIALLYKKIGEVSSGRVVWVDFTNGTLCYFNT